MKKEREFVGLRVVDNGIIVIERDTSCYSNDKNELVYQSDLEAIKDAFTRLLGKKEDYGTREAAFLDAVVAVSSWAIEIKQEILLKLNTEKIKKLEEAEPKKTDSDDGIPF